MATEAGASSTDTQAPSPVVDDPDVLALAQKQTDELQRLKDKQERAMKALLVSKNRACAVKVGKVRIKYKSRDIREHPWNKSYPHRVNDTRRLRKQKRKNWRRRPASHTCWGLNCQNEVDPTSKDLRCTSCTGKKKRGKDRCWNCGLKGKTFIKSGVGKGLDRACYIAWRKRKDAFQPSALQIARRQSQATCCLEGCTSSKWARGMCSIHYKKWYNKKLKEKKAAEEDKANEEAAKSPELRMLVDVAVRVQRVGNL